MSLRNPSARLTRFLQIDLTRGNYPENLPPDKVAFAAERLNNRSQAKRGGTFSRGTTLGNQPTGRHTALEFAGKMSRSPARERLPWLIPHPSDRFPVRGSLALGETARTRQTSKVCQSENAQRTDTSGCRCCFCAARVISIDEIKFPGGTNRRVMARNGLPVCFRLASQAGVE